MMYFDLIATLDLTPILWWIGVVLKVAVGLGAVIFVHELGHFLVARACGVKIEKFMIGFDIGGYKLSWRRGETEYGIGILPLGGYVKMLGQDDDPAHIAEQMQKSQVNAASDEGVETVGPNGEKYYVDRRSYLAKSVPQRMAIISAGVIMNVIFAFIFAVIAYGMGVSYVPSVVSETVPGSPAWKAGLEPGDEIVQIGNRVNPTFTQLRGGVTLGDLEEGIPIVIRRAANGEIVKRTLKPERNSGRLATIGVAPPMMSLTLLDTIDHSPAAKATLVEPAPKELKQGQAKLAEGDDVLRLGDVDVNSYRELSAELVRQSGAPIRITVRRPLEVEDNGEQTKAESEQERFQELTFELPPQPLHRFGLVMKLGPIAAIQAGSLAEEAGLQPGGVIQTVDGKALGEGLDPLESWDGLTLPGYLRRAALEGRSVEMTISRPQSGTQDAEPMNVVLSPEVPIMIESPLPTRPPGAPMGTNEIGIAYHIENEVVGIVPDSPAAAAKLALGDRIIHAKVTFPTDSDGDTEDPLSIELGPENRDWPRLIDAIQFATTGTEVELTVQRGQGAERVVKLSPAPLAGSFVAARGFWFRPIERTRKAETFAQQVQYGWDETAEALTLVFRFLQKLGTQVPLSALGGPVTIAKVAGYSAAEGLPSLLIFLTMLSANLAVINFLPIPLLDGGHMVFLAYEWIRGRPANEKFVVALHTAGFVLIVTLMLYVLALDVGLISRNL